MSGHVNSNNNALTNYYDIYLEVLDGQRKMLTNMNRNSEFDEELIRKYLTLTDMEELKLREKSIK